MLGGKIVPALMFRMYGMPFLQEQKTARVAAKIAPLSVVRRLFGTTKLLSSRLDCHYFSHNSGYVISVNRP